MKRTGTWVDPLVTALFIGVAINGGAEFHEIQGIGLERLEQCLVQGNNGNK